MKHSAMVHWMLAAVIVGLLAGGSLRAIPQDRRNDESAVHTAGLTLPAGLSASVKANFPSYRVPEEKDITSGWAADQKLRISSFLCVGDFNGDGIKDTALILISTSEQTWRLAVFEQSKT
jgi:hypothetical protein